MTLISRVPGWPRLAAAAVLGVGVWAGPASAVIIQDTGGALPSDIPTDALGTWGNNAAAVVVGDQWVLTTRHQDNGQVDRLVTIAGQTYNALAENQIVLDDGVDLRLVKLTEITSGNAASLSTAVNLFTGSPNNKTAVITGFGPTIGAADPGGDGFSLSGPTNNSNGLNIGQNRIENATTLSGDFSTMSVLRADFDDASGSGNVAYESSLAVGDSGGAWLVRQDSQWQLAGITHGVQQATGSEPDAFFGQNFYAVNLSVLADTIQRAIDQDYITGDYNGDDIVSQADLDLVLLNWGQAVNPVGWVALSQKDGDISQAELDGVLLNWGGTSGPDLSAAASLGAFATVPEPASALLVLAGSVGLLGVRRRKHAARA